MTLSRDTLLLLLALAGVLVCVLTTRDPAEPFEAANEHPVYWRTA